MGFKCLFSAASRCHIISFRQQGTILSPMTLLSIARLNPPTLQGALLAVGLHRDNVRRGLFWFLMLPFTSGTALPQESLTQRDAELQQGRLLGFLLQGELS